MRQRGLVVGLGGRFGSAHGLVGEGGIVVRAVSVVLLDPVEFIRAWLERGLFASAALGCWLGVCGRIGMPSASALTLRAVSSSISEVEFPAGCKTFAM